MYLLALGIIPVHVGACFSPAVAPTEDMLVMFTFVYTFEFGCLTWLILCLKLHRVFSSCRGIPASARVDQFH